MRQPARLSTGRRPRDELSPRQLEAARLRAGGLLIKEVAHAMGISMHTTETHLRYVYIKVGAHNVASLIQALTARGYLPARPPEMEDDCETSRSR